MGNSSDQFTLKAHKFNSDFAKYMKKKILDSGAEFKLTETIFFDIAMFRLKQEFDEVDWKNETKVNHFLEKLLVDIFEIQKKLVKVKIRNLPKK